MKVKMLLDEYWFGGCTVGGLLEPLNALSEAYFDLSTNPTPNQAMPFFLSSKGRYLWREQGFSICFDHGEIEVPDSVILSEGHENLRGAYLAAMARYFPFHEIHLSPKLFDAPIFNTWIEMTYNPNQTDVLRYAEAIRKNWFRPGVLMIDDGWCESYGDWRFHSGKFPTPAHMIQQLHELGFSVMLWICPYVTPDSIAFRQAKELDILVKNPDGSIYILPWWNGYSAALDLTNPKTSIWLRAQLDALLEMGIDGFKFDGGDSAHYREDNRTFLPVTPDEHCNYWSKIGERYAFNEFRASFHAGGYSLFQRLCDKAHSWGENGVKALIPDTLVQGITGHPFCCPDMVGGGDYLNFEEEAEHLDTELFVRYAGIACLMPAIQFSAAPWRVLKEDDMKQIYAQLQLRQEFAAYRARLFVDSCYTGEPIVRYMAYEFPDAGLETVTDQFMLGSRYLVAPIIEKDQIAREVAVPAGRWSFDGMVLDSCGERMTLMPACGLPVVLEKIG